MRYDDFDLSIEPRGEEYTARVIASTAGQAEVEFTLPFSVSELERINDTIEICVLRGLGNDVRRVSDPNLERLRAFGKRLFDAVFAEFVRQAYVVSLFSAEKKGAGLRIKLRLHQSVSHLPWEFLNDTTSIGDFLLLSKWTPITRFIDLPKPTRSLSVKTPLRILLVLASPRGFPPLDIASEHGLIKQAIHRLDAKGIVNIDVVMGPSTLDKLRSQLLKNQYHILHVVAHGGYDSNHHEGVLVLEDASGAGIHVGAEQLSRLFRDSRSVRLIVLNSCKGTAQSSGQAFTDIAASLVRIGTPAVIAMQFEIKDEDAITFSQSFYETLTSNYPIDAAVSETRLTLALKNPDSIAWATPVLFMRSHTGRLFRFDREIATPMSSETPFIVSAEFSKTNTAKSPKVYKPILSAKDWLRKFQMIKIPHGKFQLGAEGEYAQQYELPLHEVELSEYYIGRFPITNREYTEFTLANPDYPVPHARSHWNMAQPFSWNIENRTPPRGKEDHPVALVTWYDALAYCLWLQNITGLKFRLPTEAEWEIAAKGSKHSIYPWGNEWNPRLCNADRTVGSTTPVGFYSPQGDSEYGVADMSGNVWEWCSSIFRPYPYSPLDGRENLISEENRVLRGGSWIYSPQDARCAARNPLHGPSEIGLDGGFRIALSL